MSGRGHSSVGGDAEAIRIRLLGGFRVSVGDRTVPENAWRLRKAASLIKLLALAPGHRMHRERVMDLLWPELEASKVANNLHNSLHHARRILEPTPEAASRYLSLRGEQLVLYPEGDLWVDVEAFQEAASVARQAGELSVYKMAIDL